MTEQTPTDSHPAELSFDPAVEHVRYNVDEYDEIYVVGDVHGCITELRTLWDELSPTDNDLVVFVGDLVRKGPASTDVVEFITTRSNAVSVRGNSESKILRNRIDTEPFEPIRDEIESMPLVISWGDVMVVHGGVYPERSLSDHGPIDFLEMRSVPPTNGYDGPFWFDLYQGPPRVFFGHTVMDEPFVGEWAVGLDTGCVYGGELTAYDYCRDELISVEAEQTYQSRPDDTVIEP